MIAEKVHGLLGFARRAGKIASGEAAVEANLKKGKVTLLLLAEDLSPSVAEKYRQWCGDLGVPVLAFGEKISLGVSLGQSPRALVAILDDGFARAIHEALSGASNQSSINSRG